MMNYFLTWLTEESALKTFTTSQSPQIVAISNPLCAESRIWSCTKPIFWFLRTKLCNSDTQNNTCHKLSHDVFQVECIHKVDYDNFLDDQWVILLHKWTYRSWKKSLKPKGHVLCFFQGDSNNHTTPFKAFKKTQ